MVDDSSVWSRSVVAYDAGYKARERLKQGESLEARDHILEFKESYEKKCFKEGWERKEQELELKAFKKKKYNTRGLYEGL